MTRPSRAFNSRSPSLSSFRDKGMRFLRENSSPTFLSIRVGDRKESFRRIPPINLSLRRKGAQDPKSRRIDRGSLYRKGKSFFIFPNHSRNFVFLEAVCSKNSSVRLPRGVSQLMGSRVFYSGSPELKYLYDLITLLFTHCVVFRIPPPEVKTPNDRSRMRREESADSKRVFCCSRKTGPFFLF